MIQLTKNQQKIILIFLQNNAISSSKVHSEMVKLGETSSLVTIKRTLSSMVHLGVINISGSGRSTVYAINALGRILAHVNEQEYCAIEPDKRHGLRQYNFDLLPAFPINVFSEDELRFLKDSTTQYKKRIKDLPDTIQKKELERLIIELSWKSSKIEGNTYTLLDTEKLILENKIAPNKTKKETQMILNHKEAFIFVHENVGQFKTITKKNLEELHSILIKNLDVNNGFRKKPVGVIGSLYNPLDNIYQITEAVEILCKKISSMSSPYTKSFLALLGLAYIQPFEDGNKRTSRLLANAILLANKLAPLSYRSIDEEDYRNALLVFYELNAIEPFKKIFIDQYNFAARNYTVK